MPANPLYSIRRPAVIFDLGNVVLNFDHRRTCWRLGVRYGLAAESVYQGTFGAGHERDFDLGRVSPAEFTEACSRQLGITLDIDVFRQAWEDIFWENEPVIRLLREIRNRADLILLSNTNVWHFEYARRTFDVIGLFDKCVLCYECGARKPDRGIFELVSTLVNRESALFIDDILENVRAAEATGLRSIQFLDSVTVERAVLAHVSGDSR